MTERILDLSLYRKGPEIGVGAQARVYRYIRKHSVSNEFPETIAVKEGLDCRRDKNAKRELDLLRALRHQNIVEYLFHFEMDTGLVGIAMESCHTNADDFIREREGFELYEVSILMRQLLVAQNYLDGKNIMHRDIKPSNILVNLKFCDGNDLERSLRNASVFDVNLKLGDFGLSRFYPGSLTLTSVGTRLYAAPEIHEALSQGQASLQYDKSVDSFSLGAVAYSFFVGKSLGHDSERREMMEMAETNQFPIKKGLNQFLHGLLVLRRPAGYLLENEYFIHKAIEREDVLRMIEIGDHNDLELALPGVVPDFDGGERGRSPLTLAAGLGSDGAVAILVEDARADVNRRDGNGDTALICAAEVGGAGMVRELLTKWRADASLPGGQGRRPIMTAAKFGYIEVIRVLIEDGKAAVDLRDARGFTALHYAASKGHGCVIGVLVDKGADRDAADIGGDTPLHVAAKYGHCNALRELINSGASIDAQNLDGNTAVHLAAANGMEDAATILLQEGASINVRNKSARMALQEAVFNEQAITSKLFLDHHAETNCRDADGRTPLHIAAFNGDLEIVQSLLEHGADLTLRDKDGWTPFCYAALSDSIDVMLTIISQDKAAMSSTTSQEQSPLHIATEMANLKTVFFLLRKGCNVNCTDADEQTPLHIAVSKGYQIIAIFLLDKGANAALSNTQGRTALHLACLVGDFHGVWLFLSWSSGTRSSPLSSGLLGKSNENFINKQDKYGRTALHLACSNGHSDIAWFLIQSKAKLDIRDKNGSTALHLACNNKSETIAAMMAMKVQHATLNAQDKDRNTPLHLACSKGLQILPYTLMTLGASPNVKNKNGNTALHLACLKGNLDIVRELITAGAFLKIANKEMMTPHEIAKEEGHKNICDWVSDNQFLVFCNYIKYVLDKV